MRTEVNTIIFSKNRACQLELLLRNFSIPAVVIYKYDPEFKAGYDKLMPMYPNIKFLEQTDLKQQILDNLGEYTMFMVDDDIMVELFRVECPEMVELRRNNNILCLSLRMSPKYAGAPDMKGNNTWEWKGLKHSWGYPMSITATVFRRGDIEPTIQAATLEIPNDMEVALRKAPPARPLMSCFFNPKTITNEANNVQTKYPTPNFGVSVKELEERFLKGDRLSLQHIKNAAKTAKDCFIRIAYEWRI